MVTKKTDKSRTRRAVKAIFRPRLETMREGKMPTLTVVSINIHCMLFLKSSTYCMLIKSIRRINKWNNPQILDIIELDFYNECLKFVIGKQPNSEQ